MALLLVVKHYMAVVCAGRTQATTTSAAPEFLQQRHSVGTARVKLKQFMNSFVDKHTSFVPMSLPDCKFPHACMLKVTVGVDRTTGDISPSVLHSARPHAGVFVDEQLDTVMMR